MLLSPLKPKAYSAISMRCMKSSTPRALGKWWVMMRVRWRR